MRNFMKYQRMMMQGAGNDNQPVFVDWIATDGAAWIDTDIIMQLTQRLKVSVYTPSWPTKPTSGSSYQTVCDSGNYECYFGWKDSSTRLIAGVTTDYTQSSLSNRQRKGVTQLGASRPYLLWDIRYDTNNIIGGQKTASATSGPISLGDTVTEFTDKSSNASLFGAAKPLTLFSDSNHSQPMKNGSKVYGCIIATGDTVDHYLRPAYYYEQYGLWDTITNKFYAAGGTGVITGGYNE